MSDADADADHPEDKTAASSVLAALPPEGEAALATIGAESREVLDTLGGLGMMAFRALTGIARYGVEWSATIRQFYLMGVRSLGLALMVGLFTGMVFSLQFIVALARFGAADTVGRVTSLAIFRELGPVLTSLMVGGRIAAGITAELGSMQVSEQIDAIRALGADPIRKLVAPRITAGVLMMPLLTALADLVAVLGACVIAFLEHGLSLTYFYKSVVETNQIGDVLSGLVKTVVFGFLIALAGCYQGFQTRGGTEGVGQSTTRTVVLVTVSILFADFILTKLLLSL
jgi:phospholipid/cholesterol/gamma-HCH transport system permease protein